MRWMSQIAKILFAWLAFVALAGGPTLAQGNYPDRPVAIVVAYEAGGPTDVTARVLAQKLSVITGQRFIVLNKPGGNGIIGHRGVQLAKPDGYTVLFTSLGTMAVLPAVNSKIAFDPVKDFDGVSMVSTLSPFFMLTSAQTGITDVKTLVDQARASPGKFNFSTPGAGGTNSAAGLVFADLAKVEMIEIPYKGGTGPAVTALLGNHVTLSYANTQTFKEHADAGKIVPLAVLANERSKRLPKVPTIAEAGFPEMMQLTSWRVWQGVFAPKGTPKEIVNFLNGAINKALSDPDLQTRFETLDLEVLPGTTPELTNEILSKDVTSWKSIATRLKLEIQ